MRERQKWLILIGVQCFAVLLFFALCEGYARWRVSTRSGHRILCPQEGRWHGPGLIVQLGTEDGGTITDREYAQRLVNADIRVARSALPPVSTDDACPQRPGQPACSGSHHGLCLATGVCACHAAMTGEDCSGAVLCPGHRLCSRRGSVIAVSPWGNDEAGTGAVGDAMPAATDTFKDSFFPSIGISKTLSAFLTSAGDRPATSLPITKANFFLRVLNL